MLFLLRLAFWLTIVLALLPSGSKQPTTSGPEFGAAFSAAGAAVSDARHFCDRQPGACEVGSQLAVMIGQRAQAGAKMLYDVFNEHSGPTETGSVDKTDPSARQVQSMPLPPERPPHLNASERR